MDVLACAIAQANNVLGLRSKLIIGLEVTRAGSTFKADFTGLCNKLEQLTVNIVLGISDIEIGVELFL